jgi:hypothetical protein
MFNPTSRYYHLGKRVYADPGGQPIVYCERRFPPQGSSLPLLVEVTVKAKDRMDLIAWRTLGNSEIYWRVCDANDVLNPVDAVETGATLRVPRPLP